MILIIKRTLHFSILIQTTTNGLYKGPDIFLVKGAFVVVLYESSHFNADTR